LVTSKAGAKHEHLFNVPASEAGLLNEISCLALALGVTKFIIITDMIWVTLCLLLKSDLDVQQTHLSLYKNLFQDLKFNFEKWTGFFRYFLPPGASND
jgi:hypothetical protein